jgi:hypothetical protein
MVDNEFFDQFVVALLFYVRVTERKQNILEYEWICKLFYEDISDKIFT